MTKKILGTLVLTIIVVCAVFAMFFLTTTSCTNKQTAELTTDSVKFNKVEKSFKCNYVVDYPTAGNANLLLSVREWISEQMGGTYKGDFEKGDSVVNFYAKSEADTLKSYAKMSSPGVVLEKTVSIRKIYETPKLVTYEATSYEYAGGAHGGATKVGATFRKSDGRKFGFDMFTIGGLQSSLQDLLGDGLKGYFKVKTTEQLKDNLLNPDQAYYLPLPQALPYLTKEGITFVYAQYEIACYAAGMPTFTIPYSKIEGILTTSAAALIK